MLKKNKNKAEDKIEYLETEGNLVLNDWKKVEKDGKQIIFPVHIQYVRERNNENKEISCEERSWYNIGLSNGKVKSIFYHKGNSAKEEYELEIKDKRIYHSNSMINEKANRELCRWLPKLVRSNFQTPIITRDEGNKLVFVDMERYHVYWCGGFGSQTEHSFIDIQKGNRDSSNLTN